MTKRKGHFIVNHFVAWLFFHLSVVSVRYNRSNVCTVCLSLIDEDDQLENCRLCPSGVDMANEANSSLEASVTMRTCEDIQEEPVLFWQLFLTEPLLF